MSDQTPALDRLAAGIDGARRLVVGVGDDQWHRPTPCPDWDVRELVGHLTGGNHRFAALLETDGPLTPPTRPSGDVLGDDPQAAFEASATALLTAFAVPGRLAALRPSPLGSVPGETLLWLRVVEHLVHGWDLAQATGQRPEFAPGLAEQALEFSEANLGNVQGGRTPFGSRLPAPPDAPALDRLVALLGRRVSAEES